MNQKLISTSSTTASWIYMIVAAIWLFALLFFLLLFFFFGTDILFFVPFLLAAISYCIYSAFLHEILHDENFIYVKSVFKSDRKFSVDAFANISTKVYFLNTLKITFNSGESYRFNPRIDSGFFRFNFNATSNFIDYWNKYFKGNKN